MGRRAALPLALLMNSNRLVFVRGHFLMDFARVRSSLLHNSVLIWPVPLLALLDSGLSEVAEVLQRWAGTAVLGPHEIADPQQARLRYQASLDYQRALFQLYGQMGKTTKQRSVVAGLIY
jgi:hypothetical protein